MVVDEKQGGCAHPKRLLDGFTNTINECQLMNLGFNGNIFTCERSRGSEGWIQGRLDQELANRQLRDMFPLAEITVLDVSTSNHLFLNLYLNRKMYVPKIHRFRFENMWLKEKDCLHIIQTCWLKMAGYSITDKIQYRCLKLEEWGRGVVEEFRVKMREYMQRLKKLRSRRDGYGLINIMR